MDKTKKYQIIAIPILGICLLIFVLYGWSSFSTITQRSGLRGEMHLYYQLTRFQFAFYTTTVALISIILFLSILKNAIRYDVLKLKKSINWFIVIILLITICEIYLNLRYVGKG
jgi:hypothetical protein